MFLGNLQFNQIESKLGFLLTDEDHKTWNEFHCDDANLNGRESCFHVFDIPRCIIFKGEPAKNAILKMFTSDKITKPMGQFNVYEQ